MPTIQTASLIREVEFVIKYIDEPAEPDVGACRDIEFISIKLFGKEVFIPLEQYKSFREELLETV